MLFESADRKLLGKGATGLNDGDVASSAEKRTGVQFADLFSPNTDTVRGRDG